MDIPSSTLWRRNNPAKYAEHRKKRKLHELNSYLSRNYGITVGQFCRMWKLQNGVCAICQKKCSTGQRLSVDHCHRTQKVRKLLCRSCNVSLERIINEPEIINYYKENCL